MNPLKLTSKEKKIVREYLNGEIGQRQTCAKLGISHIRLTTYVTQLACQSYRKQTSLDQVLTKI